MPGGLCQSFPRIPGLLPAGRLDDRCLGWTALRSGSRSGERTPQGLRDISYSSPFLGNTVWLSAIPGFGHLPGARPGDTVRDRRAWGAGRVGEPERGRLAPPRRREGCRDPVRTRTENGGEDRQLGKPQRNLGLDDAGGALRAEDRMGGGDSRATEGGGHFGPSCDSGELVPTRCVDDARFTNSQGRRVCRPCPAIVSSLMSWTSTMTQTAPQATTRSVLHSVGTNSPRVDPTALPAASGKPRSKAARSTSCTSMGCLRNRSMIAS